MEAKKEIIKRIYEMPGGYSPYEVFTDWVRAEAIAIQNNCMFFQNDIWKRREEDYLSIAKKYGAGMNQMAEMHALLQEEYLKGPKDVLGDVFMEGGIGNKATGQFFTPFHLSVLTAKLKVNEVLEQYPEDEVIKLYEPSCGAGGMLIAFAACLHELGINYCTKLKIVAQDLDWKAVYTTYVQLSLLGIRAEVAQGDTLAEPYSGNGHYPKERLWRTPARLMMSW